MLASLYKARADTLPGKPNNGKCSVYVIVTFEIEGHSLTDIVSEKRPLNQNAFIKINDLGVILQEKECSID